MDFRSSIAHLLASLIFIFKLSDLILTIFLILNIKSGKRKSFAETYVETKHLSSTMFFSIKDLVCKYFTSPTLPTISEIYSAQSLSGDDFGFCVTARKSSTGVERIGNVSNIRYYIFP